MSKKSSFTYNEITMIQSFPEMMNVALMECPDKVAYKYKDGKDIVKVTFSGFAKKVYAIGEFLHSKGMNGYNYACIGANSFKWITAYFTGLLSKGAFVPLDRELPENDILHLLKDCECKVLFYNERYEQLLKDNRRKLKNIKYFIGFDRKENDGDFLSYDFVVNEGKKLGTATFMDFERDLKAMKLLVYTSGTTGMSKGVMLSEHNIINGVCGGLMIANFYDVGFSILPYNHTYECVSDLLVSFHHHSTICINDSYTAILRNLKLFKPEYIFVVPAVTDMLYSRIQREFKSKGMEKEFDSLTSDSSKVKNKTKKEIITYIKEIFGGNLKKIVCGGAPFRPEIGEFFKALDVIMVNGYGITECSPLVCVNNDINNNFNSAGIRIPCLEWKINNPNSEGIGEILVKGDVVMLGYYKRKDLTDEAIIDGWFYTGDYGMITEDDQLIICGRKKNIIVLNNGKNIYPEEIEGYIQNIDYVAEVIVSGDIDDAGKESSLQAEVYLNEKRTPAQVLKSIKAACKVLPVYKQISKVIIRDKEFEKTTTNKIKRK